MATTDDPKFLGLRVVIWKLILVMVVAFAALPFLARREPAAHVPNNTLEVPAEVKKEAAAYFKLVLPPSWTYGGAVINRGRIVELALQSPDGLTRELIEKSIDQQMAYLSSMCPNQREPLVSALIRNQLQLRLTFQSSSHGKFSSADCRY